MLTLGLFPLFLPGLRGTVTILEPTLFLGLEVAVAVANLFWDFDGDESVAVLRGTLTIS
jgi:hypothetical protein